MLSYNDKHSPTIILAGDFNQLKHSDILNLGLVSVIYAPTHKGHCLDRIYSSESLNYNIKILSATAITEHRAIVAMVTDYPITDRNKTATAVTYRRQTPGQSAAILNYLNNYTWNIYDILDLQTVANTFYSIINQLLDDFFPERTVTVTNRDPKFVTPEVKHLLRQKNLLMRSGRVEAAEAISKRIQKTIVDYNTPLGKNTIVYYIEVY